MNLKRGCGENGRGGNGRGEERRGDAGTCRARSEIQGGGCAEEANSLRVPIPRVSASLLPASPRPYSPRLRVPAPGLSASLLPASPRPYSPRPRVGSSSFILQPFPLGKFSVRGRRATIASGRSGILLCLFNIAECLLTGCGGRRLSSGLRGLVVGFPVSHLFPLN